LPCRDPSSVGSTLPRCPVSGAKSWSGGEMVLLGDANVVQFFLTCISYRAIGRNTSRQGYYGIEYTIAIAHRLYISPCSGCHPDRDIFGTAGAHPKRDTRRSPVLHRVVSSGAGEQDAPDKEGSEVETRRVAEPLARLQRAKIMGSCRRDSHMLLSVCGGICRRAHGFLTRLLWRFMKWLCPGNERHSTSGKGFPDTTYGKHIRVSGQAI